MRTGQGTEGRVRTIRHAGGSRSVWRRGVENLSRHVVETLHVPCSDQAESVFENPPSHTLYYLACPCYPPLPLLCSPSTMTAV